MPTRGPIRPVFRNLTFLLLCLSAVAACVRPSDKPRPPAPRYVAVPFDRLPGWSSGEQAKAMAALRRSCAKLLTGKARAPQATSPKAPRRTIGDWRRACRAVDRVAASGKPPDSATTRRVIQAQFVAYRLFDANKPRSSLFTGYFEPLLLASPTRTARYRFPIYGLPASAGGKSPTRAEIAANAPRSWPVLYWAADPIDVFVMHIQGSGLLHLPSGRTVRVGYAGNNGHGYRSIGRLMVKRELIARETASMQTIVAWLKAHPAKRQAILNHNPRFIFFRRLKSSGPGPLGAAGLVLTPGRSLAVDPAFVAYGTPIWLSTRLPSNPGASGKPFRRLMVAQDTGSAIRGPVRGDIFFGAGAKALEIAGRMKSPGQWFILLPR